MSIRFLSFCLSLLFMGVLGFVLGYWLCLNLNQPVTPTFSEQPEVDLPTTFPARPVDGYTFHEIHPLDGEPRVEWEHKDCPHWKVRPPMPDSIADYERKLDRHSVENMERLKAKTGRIGLADAS